MKYRFCWRIIGTRKSGFGSWQTSRETIACLESGSNATVRYWIEEAEGEVETTKRFQPDMNLDRDGL